MNLTSLVFDLDGTAVPNQLEGMPSKKVVESVDRARRIVDVSVATGRPWKQCANIVKALNIKLPCIINGGTQVVDPLSGNPIWEQFLTINQAQEILQIAKDLKISACFDDGSENDPIDQIVIKRNEKIFFFVSVSESLASQVFQRLEKIEDVAVSYVPSWSAGIDIHVVHKLGTKKHALEKLLEIEKIDPHGLMVVGDGGNDLPLFEKAAFKVAMGNANEKLKDAADVIAPSVNEDGLAWAIDKYILSI